MKKLYDHTKGKIHPSPPPPSTTTHLSLLPLAISTLAAALSPEDQETLAYLLSSSTTAPTAAKPTSKSDHPPQFNCKCFQCYTSFWVRWDASPKRKKIHEIIDAYEDGLIHTKKGNTSKNERKSMKALASSSLKVSHAPPCDGARQNHGPPESEQKRVECEEEVVSEKGSVRKIVGFIGERIWGVWGI